MVANKRIYLTFIIVLIVSITLLHYATSLTELELHELYRRLYYIPIIIAAFVYGIRGGVITPAIVALLYLPYIIYFISDKDIITNLFEVIMFFTVGSITGILAEKLNENIIEKNKLQQELLIADKMSAIGQLASGIAHEIRNPLAIIKTILQTQKMDLEVVSNEDNKEAIEIMIHEINRADNVVKELLDFSKNNNYEKSKILLNELLDNIITLTKKYAQKKNVTINKDDDGIEDIMIYGDDKKLKQAFINIIFNAVDAIDHEGEISISLKKVGQTAVIRFRDTGKGIPQIQLNEIFNPFFTTKDTGTGLGLSITYRIINEHKGNIVVDSKVGQGTMVKIIIPTLEEF